MSNLYLDGNEKKIFLKWEEIILSVFLIGGFIVYFALRARNPFKIDDMNNAALEYVQQNHPEIRDMVEINGEPYFTSADETQEWWDGKWHIGLINPEDNHMRFYIIFNRKGDVLFDGYKDFYLKGGTIYDDAAWKYEAYFSRIFEKYYSEEDKGKFIITGMNNAQGVAGFGKGHSNWYKEFTDAEIDINKTYTMEELAMEYGWLQFTFNDDEATVENMIKRVDEAKVIIKENDIPCKSVRIWLDKTYTIQTDNLEEFMNSDTRQYVNDNIINIKEELKNAVGDVLKTIPDEIATEHGQSVVQE